MKDTQISLNMIWYTYTALIPTNMMFSLLNKCKFSLKCVSWSNDQNTGEKDACLIDIIPLKVKNCLMSSL